MRALWLLLISFASTPAWGGDDSCYAGHLVVDQHSQWDFRAAPSEDFFLPSLRQDGSFLTMAAAHFHWRDRLDVTFDYPLPPEQMGLPYTLYRVQVTVGEGSDRFVYNIDFTQNCTDPGFSYFPRSVLVLSPIKIPPRADGSPRENEQVNIRIWGHL